MNTKAYIFGNLQGGYTQYPDDYSNDIFNKMLEKSNAPSQMVVHRSEDIMYYGYTRQLSNDQYIGFCVMLNGLMIVNVDGLFNLFETNFERIPLDGQLLSIADDGELETRVERNFNEKHTAVEDVLQNLCNSFQTLASYACKLPSVKYSNSKDEIKQFAVSDPNDQIVEATHTVGYTYIYKDKDYETARLGSYREKVATKAKENKHLQQQVEAERAKNNQLQQQVEAERAKNEELQRRIGGAVNTPPSYPVQSSDNTVRNVLIGVAIVMAIATIAAAILFFNILKKSKERNVPAPAEVEAAIDAPDDYEEQVMATLNATYDVVIPGPDNKFFCLKRKTNEYSNEYVYSNFLYVFQMYTDATKKVNLCNLYVGGSAGATTDFTNEGHISVSNYAADDNTIAFHLTQETNSNGWAASELVFSYDMSAGRWTNLTKNNGGCDVRFEDNNTKIRIVFAEVTNFDTAESTSEYKYAYHDETMNLDGSDRITYDKSIVRDNDPIEEYDESGIESSEGDETETFMIGDVVYGTEYDVLSYREITGQELQSLNSAQLRILRNSIYARHGKIFSDESLRSYFGQYSWYNPTRSEIPQSELNEYEKKNIELIERYE